MTYLTRIGIIITLAQSSIIISRGQASGIGHDRFLTYYKNENWLKATKALDKSGKVRAIQQRFFAPNNQNLPRDSTRYSPLIIVNGVPFNIPEKLSEDGSGKIVSLLTENSIAGVGIIDKLESPSLHNAISGAILLTVNKKTEKQLFKLKLE